MKSSSFRPLACPKCQSELITNHGKRYALYPVGCVIISLPLAWLHRASTPHDSECRECGHAFSERTTAAKVAFASLWLAGGLVIWFIVKMF